MRGTLAAAAVAAFAGGASAFEPILIDTFDGGYFRAEITGEGSRDNLAFGLDRSRVYAGHRNTTYIVSGNPFGYTTSVEVGRGEARVTTPGPNDLSTTLGVAYGTGYFAPMDLDLSAFQNVGRLIEIDLATDPPDLFAEVWSINLRDGAGRAVSNGRWGGMVGGIQFRRDGFVGNPAFDWSDVDEFAFVQSWNRQNSAPLSYWATEIRVVPEPSGLVAGGLGMLALVRAGRRTRRRGRRSSTSRR